MLRKRQSRRILTILMAVLGGVLIYLAPESWAGVVLLGLGVALEVAGIALEHRG